MQYDDLKTYAIQHKRTGRLITGTEFGTYRQRFNPYYPPLLYGGMDIEFQFNRRQCSPMEYRIVEVKVRIKGA